MDTEDDDDDLFGFTIVENVKQFSKYVFTALAFPSAPTLSMFLRHKRFKLTACLSATTELRKKPNMIIR